MTVQTAVSVAGVRGGVQPAVGVNQYTIGTSAPTASTDFEVRWNVSDQNSKTLTREDIVLFLKQVVRDLEVSGQNITNLFASSPSSVTGPGAPAPPGR